MENAIFWTIWTVILLVKHGTALTVNQELSIAEGLPTYSEVGKLRDSPPYSQLFDNSKNPVSADLDINLVTGLIKTKIILDREVRSLYTFNVISGSQNNIAVTVKVEDVNDHSPKFPKDVIKLYISENAPLGANNQLGSAIDPDIGNKTTQRYEIVEGNRNNTFSLDSKRAGDILLLDLVVNGQLDYDDPSLRTFNLLIKAFDGGNPPRFGSMRVIVHLSDANDNPPQFVVSRYSAKVMENATVGASIIQVLATDVDSGLFGHVEYSIDRDRSDRTDMFTINKNSGIIYLNRQLDYETKRSYELIVVAKDSPNATEPLETTAIVSIEVGNINEYPPSIDLLFLTEITDDSSPKLSEKASPGDYVARISVSDPDVPLFFANINVTLNGGDGHFGLTTQNNVVYLMIVSNPLDRENRPAYHLTIVATDSGVPPLTSTKSFNLLVSDTNDNAPVFTSSEYKAEVAEVSPVGTPVIKVTANDKDFGNNSVVTYSIHGGHHSTWFEIDPPTGLIKTAARLDCETVSQPRITVRATDHGTPPLWGNAVVVISILDVNDNQPVFDKSYYGASVKESTQPGSCVLQVSATDPDCGLNARVTYAVSSNSGFQQPLEFAMQNETGNICINSPLDYETKSVYEFQVVARDSGKTKVIHTRTVVI